jgi:hypothetical protein
MAELTVNIEGYGQYRLALSLHDPGDAEVWLATFTDRLSEDEWTVYFEMPEDDYEVWDLIDVAIETYRDEYKPDQNQI